MSEPSKWAVEAARNYYRMIYDKPGRAGEDTLRDAFQSAIDAATADSKKQNEYLRCQLDLHKKELARLKHGDFTPEEFQQLCHNRSEDQASRCAFFDGCHEYQLKLFGVSERQEKDKEIEWLRICSDAHSRQMLSKDKGITEMAKLLDTICHDSNHAPNWPYPQWCPRCAWERMKEKQVEGETMKTAEEWKKELVDVGMDIFGKDGELVIRAIQADALRHAARLCRRAPVDENPDLRVVCARSIEAEAAKLTAAAPPSVSPAPEADQTPGQSSPAPASGSYPGICPDHE